MLRRLLDRAGQTSVSNIAMLVIGYGFGQGSIFLAQTWLLASGQLHLLALFGTHFAFAMFGIIVVDGGALILLARHAASMVHGEETASLTWQTFWEASCFRLALAGGVIATSAVFAIAVSEPFTHAFAICAAPAFLLWALNAAGLLDGLRLSGISGVTGSLAYASSSLMLLFVQDADPQIAGALLGAAFSGGYLLTVVVQFAALRVVGMTPRLERPTVAGVIRTTRDGLAILGGSLPGQAYYRVQLLMSSAVLGPAPTALFVYVKQIVTAMAQIVSFFRRVEFPGLVQALSAEVDSVRRVIWRQQKRGTYLAFAATACLLIFGFASVIAGRGLSANLGWYLVAFAPSVATVAISMAFSQGVAARGHYGVASLSSMLAAIVGICLSNALLPFLGIYAFAIADIASPLVSASCLLYAIRHR